MRELMNKAGEIGQDNLIAGVFPPAEITGIKIAAGQGQLFRPFFLPFPCDARICRAEVSGDSVVYMAQEQALCGYAVRFLHPG